MNPLSLDDARTLFDEMENDVYKLRSAAVEAVVCMPYLFLSDFDCEGRIKLGAQDLFWEKQGEYTGEISADMLRKVGVKYSLLGHSERRRHLGETDKMVNLKLRACLAGGLRPIVCVGETLEERKSGEAGDAIAFQLERALENIAAKELTGRLLVAYEPVWAVGSDMTPSTDDVMSAGLLIRKVLSKTYGDRGLADRTPVLYGGSVSRANCFDLVDKTGLNGLLVGRASLDPREFLAIIRRFLPEN
jgi:triosephosphate isomerase